MTSYTVRTSWADADAGTMGKRFGETFVEHAGPGVGLEIITDAQIHDQFGGWIAQNSTDETTSGCYKRGAVKWFHKVAALNMQPWPDTEWMLWFDADVEFTAPFTWEDLRHITVDLGAVRPIADFDRGSPDIVYLGRPWAYASETGFVAYRITHEPVQELLIHMLADYLRGRVWQHENWGDGAAFDRALDAVPGITALDLTGHLIQTEVEQQGMHVWPDTPLAEFCRHNKGPKRKAHAYG